MSLLKLCTSLGPQVLWVGVGCQRETSRQMIEAAIQQICQQNQLAEDAIAGVATIDHKADQLGLVELCCDRHWFLRSFSHNILLSVRVPNPSATVAANVGTPSVAEAAALCASLDAECDLGMVSGIAANKTQLLVPKQIFRLEGQPGSVTVAIAQTERRSIGPSK